MEPFIGMIIPWPVSWAPMGWMYCDGSTISIAQNQALFSLIGFTYGGDGHSVFALPDLRSRIPVGAASSQPQDLSRYQLAQKGGTEQNTLTVDQMPAHIHPLSGCSADFAAGGASASVAIPVNDKAQSGNTAVPSTTAVLGGANMQENDVSIYQSPSQANTTLQPFNAPVNNIQPFLALNYIICVSGLYPTKE